MGKFKVGDVVKKFWDVDIAEIKPTVKHPYEELVELLHSFGYNLDVGCDNIDSVDCVSVWVHLKNYDTWSVGVGSTLQVEFKTLKALLEHQKSLEDSHG